MKVIPVPNLGNVAFPPDMKDADIQQAIAKLGGPVSDHVQAVVENLVKEAGSKGYEQKAQLAKLLEANPALAALAHAGLQAAQPSATPPATGTAPAQPAVTELPQKTAQSESNQEPSAT